MKAMALGRGWVVTLVSTGLVGLVLTAAACGQDTTPAKEPAAKPADKPAVAKVSDEKPAATKGKAKAKSAPRLPAHYKDVVSDEQKAKIFAIQKELGPKIAELRKQLASLTAEQTQKIEAVLTPEQLKKIEELKAAAKKQRDAKKSAKPK
jgi:hypothetical protein